jgi:hypothetical protein
MPSEETRRLLKVFGVAVTNLEDAATTADRDKWDAELRQRLAEVQEHVEKLRRRPRQ